jgi:hypothetical protein
LANAVSRLVEVSSPNGAKLQSSQVASQPFQIQAMCLGNTGDQVSSGVLSIYPALTEVVEHALLEVRNQRGRRFFPPGDNRVRQHRAG